MLCRHDVFRQCGLIRIRVGRVWDQTAQPGPPSTFRGSLSLLGLNFVTTSLSFHFTMSSTLIEMEWPTNNYLRKVIQGFSMVFVFLLLSNKGIFSRAYLVWLRVRDTRRLD